MGASSAAPCYHIWRPLGKRSGCDSPSLTLTGPSTFTFSKDAVDLFQSGRIAAALVNVGVHVVLGLAAVGGGYALARLLQRWQA